MSIDNLTPTSNDFVGVKEERKKQKHRENNDKDFYGVISGGVFLVKMEARVYFADHRGNRAASEEQDEDDHA